MEPITLITMAIVAGIVSAARPVAKQAVKDAYQGLKTLITDKYHERQNLKMAWQAVENAPEDEAWRKMLEAELQNSGADQDREVQLKAQELQNALVEHDPQAYGDINVDLETIKSVGSIIVESEAAGGGSVDVKGRAWESGADVRVSSKTSPKVDPPA